MKIVAKYPETMTNWPSYELENGWLVVLGDHDIEIWVRGKPVVFRVDGGWCPYNSSWAIYPCRCAAVAAALMM